jgi:CheY-like chemotaxis protein
MTSVLVTDESRFSRLALRKLIEKLRPGWTVQECSSPTEVFTLLQAGGLDAVLIDYHMPQMNGLVLADTVRKRFSGVPVALVSANLREQVKGESERLGVHYIPKPVCEAELAGFLASVEA